jgi:hypothetical protein
VSAESPRPRPSRSHRHGEGLQSTRWPSPARAALSPARWAVHHARQAPPVFRQNARMSALSQSLLKGAVTDCRKGNCRWRCETASEHSGPRCRSDPSMTADIDQLRDAIRRLHGCGSTHIRSVPVTETFQGVAWDGPVEVFRVFGHSCASICYAWLHEGQGGTRPIAVLEIPPVNSPRAAVQAAILAASDSPLVR